MLLRLEKLFQDWILISFVLQQVYANITIIVLLLKEVVQNTCSIYVLFVLEKRRYLGLFVVKTDAVRTLSLTLTSALKCCYRKANELFWCSLCKEVDIFKVTVSLK